LADPDELDDANDPNEPDEPDEPNELDDPYATNDPTPMALP
jgi:hypothetical protein